MNEADRFIKVITGYCTKPGMSGTDVCGQLIISDAELMLGLRMLMDLNRAEAE